jgi:hypothetical protein
VTAEKHRVVVDRRFVDHWAGRYVADTSKTERELFDEVGPRARRRGFYTRDELMLVGEWKSPRARPRLASNSDEDVEDVTRLAFEAPDRFRHCVLEFLAGVGTPIASALLAVWHPDEHTVFDVRASGALRALGELAPDATYLAYVEQCRSVAARIDVSLRDLDRALWTWDKAGRPSTLTR